jgi:hypothetical protein
LSHPDIPLLSNRKECDCRSSRRHQRDTRLSDEVGVGVKAGPDGAGVTVGEPREHRDRDRTTVIKQREPRETDRTTVIKKENEDGSREKSVIHTTRAEQKAPDKRRGQVLEKAQKFGARHARIASA